MYITVCITCICICILLYVLHVYVYVYYCMYYMYMYMYITVCITCICICICFCLLLIPSSLLFLIVYSFLVLVPFLLSLDEATFVLSEKLNQDNVEVFFGKQRACCWRGDNPIVHQFMFNIQGICTTRSLFMCSCLNIGGTIKRKQLDSDKLNQPLTSIFCSINLSSYAATAIVGVVNFLTTLITVFVVDKVSQIQTPLPLHVSLGWT